MMNTDITREAIQELQEVRKAWEDSVKYAHKLELRVQELEKTEAHFEAELNATQNDYARYKLLKETNVELLEALETLSVVADTPYPIDKKWLSHFVAEAVRKAKEK